MPRHSPYALIRLNFLLNFLQLFSLNCLSFIEHCLVCWFLSAFAVKRFDPFYVFSVRLRSFNLTFGNCSSLPKFFGKTYSNLLLKCVLFYLFVSTHFTSLFGFQWTFSLIGLLLTLLVKLYQLLAAGTACWWAQVDSNHRPRAYQARALTTWAMSPCNSRCISFIFTHHWWRWRESNPWPPACRAGALPAELHPHLMR